MQRDDTPSDTSAKPLELSPLYIPGLIEPIQTPGAVGGINRNMIHANAEGLLVILQPYLNMQQGDWVEIFWGNDTVPVAADSVLPEHLGSGFPIFIPAGLVPEGINELHAKVTRASNGNEESSPKMAILVRTLLPGGIDPEPGTPGHQNLLPPEPELPPSGIIDEDAAKNGIKVRIPAYPNIREFDTLTFSWGGVQLRHEVTPADITAGAVELLVTEEVILEAGASDQLLLEYWIWDEVHNLASDWSLHTYVTVEVGEGLFDPPLIENPDPNADPYDVIDLEDLGDDDLLVSVMVVNGGGLQAGDLIAPKWIGTTAQGLPIEFSPAPESVPRVPTVMTFLIPNAEVRGLAQGRGIASYAVSRDGTALGNSKRAFVNFVGAEANLPKPVLPDAVDGVLSPTLASTTLVVPGAALEAGDRLLVTWLGTRANGSPLVHEFVRDISGGGAGQPVTLPIDGPSLLAPLDGGTLAVYYKLVKGGTGPELHSAREQVQVGEAQAELPAPSTRPPAVDGVLDPEGVALELEIVVAPYPDMQAGQTLRLIWKASSGPAHGDYMPISPSMVGKDVVFYMDRATLDQYVDATVEVSYQVERAGEPTRVSQVARFSVGARQEISDGPLRILGARWSISFWRRSAAPRRMVALDDKTLQPAVAEWRYETDQQWTASTQWIDTKPWQKLYVRSRSETWECRAVNIAGAGYNASYDGPSSFLAIRDEVPGENAPRVDMVAWGNPAFGGALDSEAAKVDNVAEVVAGANSYAVRLSDGNVIWWSGNSTTQMINGDFDLLSSSNTSFVARKTNGELFSWGGPYYVVPVPDPILEHRDYIDICSTQFAYAAIRATGHIVAWGLEIGGGQLRQGQEQFDDISSLASSGNAFAALRTNGSSRSVIAWGNADGGGLVPDDISRLNNIERIAASTYSAFCILLQSGAIKAWPDSNPAGALPEDVADLTNVVDVSATGYAFCAVLSTGKVKAWGEPSWGGDLTPAVELKSNIVQVVGNRIAFAALCSDGTVVAWGDSRCGGDTSPVAAKLNKVVAIYGNYNGFTALTSDGRVVTWGVPAGGGNSDSVQHQLNGRVTARRLLPLAEAEAVARGIDPTSIRT